MSWLCKILPCQWPNWHEQHHECKFGGTFYAMGRLCGSELHSIHNLGSLRGDPRQACYLCAISCFAWIFSNISPYFVKLHWLWKGLFSSLNDSWIRCTTASLIPPPKGVGLFGNLAVVFVVALTGKVVRSSTNLFLVNLSVADLLLLVVSTPTALVEIALTPDWIWGKVSEHWTKMTSSM